MSIAMYCRRRLTNDEKQKKNKIKKRCEKVLCLTMVISFRCIWYLKCFRKMFEKTNGFRFWLEGLIALFKTWREHFAFNWSRRKEKKKFYVWKCWKHKYRIRVLIDGLVYKRYTFATRRSYFCFELLFGFFARSNKKGRTERKTFFFTTTNSYNTHFVKGETDKVPHRNEIFKIY